MYVIIIGAYKHLIQSREKYTEQLIIIQFIIVIIILIIIL